MIHEVAELQDEQRASVTAAAGLELLERLRGVDDYDWVPIEQHMVVLDALFSQLGPSEFIAFYRRVAFANFQSGLLRAIAVSGVRVFGRRALLRVLPRGWKVVIKGCGHLRVERDAKAGVTHLLITELPPILAASDAWRLSLGAVLAATLDLGKYIGRVKMDEGHYSDGALRYTVSLIVQPTNDPADGSCGGVTEAD
jgi:hypothetical protein